jgi:hypothetical protein
LSVLIKFTDFSTVQILIKLGAKRPRFFFFFLRVLHTFIPPILKKCFQAFVFETLKKMNRKETELLSLGNNAARQGFAATARTILTAPEERAKRAHAQKKISDEYQTMMWNYLTANPQTIAGKADLAVANELRALNNKFLAHPNTAAGGSNCSESVSSIPSVPNVVQNPS